MLQKDLYIAALFEKMRFLLQEKDEWKVSFRNRCKAYSLLWSSITTKLNFECEVSFSAPWVPEVFLAYRGNFRCWPKADTARKNLWHGAVLFTVPVDLWAFYRITFIRHSDWKSPTVIMWTCTWNNVHYPQKNKLEFKIHCFKRNRDRIT